MLILASASPRRHELLLAAGIDHLVQPTHVPEIRYPHEPPASFVRRIAEAKAQPITPSPADIVLAADTIVCIGEEVLGKPVDDADAVRMLRLLSGRTHSVHTGIYLRNSQRAAADLATTQVEFINLTEDEIEGYTRSGEGRDKAGAYAIQGLASKFVHSIQGCYHNVVGLPISLVYSYLKAFNYL
jgi:septum formation protein